MKVNIQDDYTLGIFQRFSGFSNFIIASLIVVLFVFICSSIVILTDLYLTTDKLNLTNILIYSFAISILLFLIGIYTQLYLIQKHLEFLKNRTEFADNNMFELKK